MVTNTENVQTPENMNILVCLQDWMKNRPPTDRVLRHL